MTKFFQWTAVWLTVLAVVFLGVHLIDRYSYPDANEVDELFESLAKLDDDQRKQAICKFIQAICDPETVEHDKVAFYFWVQAANYYHSTSDEVLLDCVDEFPAGGGFLHNLCYFYELIRDTQGFRSRYCGANAVPPELQRCLGMNFHLDHFPPCPQD